jgi:hypothetical protein
MSCEAELTEDSSVYGAEIVQIVRRDRTYSRFYTGWVMQGSCRSFGNVRYSLLEPTFDHFLCSSPPTAKASVLQRRDYDLPTLKLAAMNSMAATRR